MSATLIGSVKTQNSKQLRKVVSNTEIDGLVLLTETYTIRRADEDYFRLVCVRNVLHDEFSSSNTQYERMAIETIRIDPLDGDYSSLTVNYAGLTTSALNRDEPNLPKAYVTVIGQIGAGIFGADVAIVARYLSTASIYEIVQGGTISLNLRESNLSIPSKKLMPPFINGTAMPANPIPRQYRRTKTLSEQQRDYNAWAEDYKKNNPNTIIGPPVFNYTPTQEWLYAGYVQSGLNIEQRGLFLQIEEQFTEYFSGSDIFYTANGVPDVAKILGFSPTVQMF